MSSYSQGNSVPLGGNIVNSNEDNNISACKQYIEFIIKDWEDDDYLEIRALENNNNSRFTDEDSDSLSDGLSRIKNFIGGDKRHKNYRTFCRNKMGRKRFYKFSWASK
jgi:hypothetical protein